LIDPEVVRIVPEHERVSPDNKWEFSTLEDAGDMRRRGEESSYYARLRSGRHSGAWIRVSATPMMLAHAERGRDVARLAHVFASVEEVDPVIARELDAYVAVEKERKISTEKGIAEGVA
jgi:hypothetical protein